MFSRMLTSNLLAVTAVISAALLPFPLSAQRAASDSISSVSLVTTRTSAAQAATSLAPAQVGISRVAPINALGVAQLPQKERNMGVGPNLALMGTGAAAVVIGLLIGGDGGTAIALGGGALGLVGFYRYLR